MFTVAGMLALTLMQSEDSVPDSTLQRWTEFYQQAAADYSIELATEPAHRLKMQPKSIFPYTNPQRERGQHGAVFVWTYNGRPEAVGTIWSIRNRNDAKKTTGVS